MSTDTQQARKAKELADEILSKRIQRLKTEIKIWPRSNTYASQIPTCIRQGYYAIKEWDKVKLHDTDLQARFNKGKQEEANLVSELMSLGFEIVEQQVPLEKSMVEKYRISGKIDGKIRYKGQKVPFEVKSMNPMSYGKVKTLDDIRSDTFLQKYYRQIQVYLLGHNEPEGLFLLTDCLGHWKIIPVELDYEAAEKILNTVEEINKSVDSSTLPERIPYDPIECGRCPFAHICLPDVLNQAKVQWDHHPKMAQYLERLDELKPLKHEYEEIYDEIKETFRDVPMAVVGRWLVTGKPSKRKSYEIPVEVKKKYEKSKETWLMKIQATDQNKTPQEAL